MSLLDTLEGKRVLFMNLDIQLPLGYGVPELGGVPLGLLWRCNVVVYPEREDGYRDEMAQSFRLRL